MASRRPDSRINVVSHLTPSENMAGAHFFLPNTIQTPNKIFAPFALLCGYHHHGVIGRTYKRAACSLPLPAVVQDSRVIVAETVTLHRLPHTTHNHENSDNNKQDSGGGGASSDASVSFCRSLVVVLRADTDGDPTPS